jgi:hypothetical protein
MTNDQGIPQPHKNKGMEKILMTNGSDENFEGDWKDIVFAEEGYLEGKLRYVEGWLESKAA